ncbi:uncharacterized protein LOC113862111 [Abrus precatorius]|uniref:Uncharacterized protein LOC113862111 n=1 Tax=Abrus precatorius TaxID=3816 RepID=A0A8B8L4D4_ABRPR|nr:uncharacterized protein LOC113862111 [Abrus precatorius]
MEQFMSAFQIRMMLATLIVSSVNLVDGQVSTPCTTSMMSSFTPCANIITGSTNKVSMPSTTCCDSLRSLMSTNMDCACMVISANAPFFQQPISQALTLSLSRACNINGLPLQCKASGSPLPAPGPAVLGRNGPPLPSIAVSPLSPQVSKIMALSGAQRNENLQLGAAPAEAEAEAETRDPEIHPVLTLPSYSSSVSPSLHAFVIRIKVRLSISSAPSYNSYLGET